MTRARAILPVPAVVVAMVVLAAAIEPALAQAGPFGVGAPEVGGGSHGGIFGWIAAQQSAFYRSMTTTLKAMRTDPHAGWWLIAVAFAYGVFHAAGPGHGKAVITSYVLANNQTWKRGVFLSFVSALFQGAVAIGFVGVAITVFRLTSLQMTDATMALERTSAMAILALGLWLGWTKIVAPLLAARTPVEPVVASEDGAVDCAIGSVQAQPISAVLCGCGQSHGPDPSTLEGTFDLRRAFSAIVAVGVRPCTGALIVLVFAFAQGLIWAGMAAVTAMAIGTGLTVAALATIAVTARGFALRIAGEDGPWPLRILRTAEIGGALMVLSMGILLTGAAFTGGGGAG